METHISVLLNESINYLNVTPGKVIADGTVGMGGHSFEIAKILNGMGKIIAFDRDSEAIEIAKSKLSNFSNIIYINDNYKNMEDRLFELEIEKVDGILLDLGASSYQFDNAERGFSYMNDAPLDMRMDRSDNFSAYNIINEYSEKDITQILYNYGEEKWSKRIAQFIVETRKHKKIETTFELVDAIKRAVPKAVRREGPHPAKRTFQAIRIETNNELYMLKECISKMIGLLSVGGRIAIITFHSLEDRIVKNAFREAENPCTCPIDFPVCICGKKSEGRIITRKPIIPSENELEHNHRARSAKLRVFEKI